MTSPAEIAIAEVRALLEVLERDHPDLAEDERAWLAAIEGETSAIEVAERLMAKVAQRRRLADDAARELADIQARESRFRDQARRLEGTVLRIMEAAQIKRLERGTFDVRLRSGAMRVTIEDETRLPPQFIRTRAEPDKASIRQALMAEGSQAVPGARLEQGPAFLQVSLR